jgi:hypothetical protein
MEDSEERSRMSTKTKAAQGAIQVKMERGVAWVAHRHQAILRMETLSHGAIMKGGSV